MRLVGRPNCGTLPDVGNVGDDDRHRGDGEPAPLAEGMSTTSHRFDAAGEETRTNDRRLLETVRDEQAA